MRKVYIVLDCGMLHDEFIGAFSSRKAAEAFVKDIKEFTIIQVELNIPYEFAEVR